MSEVIENTEITLREIKECQNRHNTTSCDFCKEAIKCEKKHNFEQMTELNLQENIGMLKECQKKHNLQSCLQCQEVLECAVRNRYVNAVYLSMNKGNGGSFEF